jgi:hypothetical protein
MRGARKSHRRRLREVRAVRVKASQPFTGNFCITIGKYDTYRLAGKPLIHNGRKPQ